MFSPLPRAPFSLGILSLELESLSGSKANTGSIVILQRGSPTCTLSTRLGLWAYPIELRLRQPAKKGSVQGGVLRRVLIYCTSGARSIPFLSHGKCQDRGKVWVLPDWIQGLGDGGQDLHVYLYLLLRILGWTLHYLESSRKILGSTNQVS